jgi:NADPH2:quinone reductase
VRAVICSQLGPPSSLTIGTMPDPVPGPGQVLIDVAAAGVNYVDALFVQGRYQIKPPLPFVPGSEVAGTVAVLGPGTSGIAVGDRVVASIGIGGFAEQAVVAADAVTPLPGNMDFARGATFTQSYSTALFALREQAGIAAGESVLVLGAGGGVGLAAIDVARMLGAVAIAAASSPEKRGAALGAGAAYVIDPGAESLKERARALAGGTGVDLVLDPVGGDLAEPALRALGDGGRYLVIGFASGTIPRLPLNQVLLRNRSVVGVDWGAWAMAHPAAQQALLGELLDLAAAGGLHPPAPTAYGLSAAPAALDDLLSRRVVGKVALAI